MKVNLKAATACFAAAVIAAGLCVLLTSGCRNPDTGVLSRDKFILTYIELLDRGDLAVRYPDSVRAISKEVFIRQDIREEQFFATVEKFRQDPKLWKEFYEEVVRRLEERDAAKNKH